jgi:hypothetical protein
MGNELWKAIKDVQNEVSIISMIVAVSLIIKIISMVV